MVRGPLYPGWIWIWWLQHSGSCMDLMKFYWATRPGLLSRLRSRFGSLFASHPVSEVNPIWTNLNRVVSKNLEHILQQERHKNCKCCPAPFFFCGGIEICLEYKRPSTGAQASKGLLIDQFFGAPAKDPSSCPPVN